MKYRVLEGDGEEEGVSMDDVSDTEEMLFNQKTKEKHTRI